MEPPWTYLVAGVVAVGLFQLLRIARRPSGYPPGPPTIPILGNLHLIDPNKTHLQFQKWADQYGYVESFPRGKPAFV